jgi:hypothetical protein
VPETSLRALDVTSRHGAQVSIDGNRAEPGGGTQDMLKAHHDMEPVQHDSRARQHGALKVPQTDVTIRQHSGWRPTPHTRSDQGTSEIVSVPAIAGEGETVLSATGIYTLPAMTSKLRSGRRWRLRT